MSERELRGPADFGDAALDYFRAGGVLVYKGAWLKLDEVPIPHVMCIARSSVDDASLNEETARSDLERAGAMLDELRGLWPAFAAVSDLPRSLLLRDMQDRYYIALLGDYGIKWI